MWSSRRAISVSNLGKRYLLGGRQEAYATLRETLMDAAHGVLRRLGGSRGKGREGRSEQIWALRDVSLEVGAGEVVGIIGRNGAGKSTLLKVLARITAPSRGRAEIHGRVGSLLEVGTGFHNELTGRENIYLNGAILGMRRKEIQRKFDQIVDFAEVARFIDTPVKHYSSGMYLRLAFAVAAHMETEILLVDEVLAVGDAAFQKRCLGKMEEAASTGRTVLFVSHNMPAVTGLCRRAIWMDSGEIAADGDVEEVAARYLSKLSEGTFRYVNQAAGLTIERVLLRDSRGEPRTYFQPGDDLVVEVDYRAGRPIRQPYLTIVVYGVHGPCFSANMLLDGRRPAALEGSGRLQCRFRSVPLLPQIYTVRMAIRKNDGKEQIVALQEVASFTVGGSLVEHGFRGEFQAAAARSTSVVIPYEWILPDGSRQSVALAAAGVAAESAFVEGSSA
jgi:homopolymeric O-antigen transport system ATP-binding protein